MKRLLKNGVIQAIILMISVFALQLYFGNDSSLFVLNVPLEEHYWTILTSIYSHGSFSHLTSNIIGLLVFAVPIARLTSNLRFHLFFVLVGVIAGVSQVLTLYYLDFYGFLDLESIPGVLGSSGAVFGFFGYLLVSNSVTGFFAKYMNPSSIVRYILYLSIAVFVTLATASPGVALIAHFTGFLLGLLIGRTGFLKLNSSSN